MSDNNRFYPNLRWKLQEKIAVYNNALSKSYLTRREDFEVPVSRSFIVRMYYLHMEVENKYTLKN